MSAAAKLKIEDPVRTTARTYLGDLAYSVLVGREEPAKTGEVLRDIGVDDLTLRLIRQTLTTDIRFEQLDRRWTTSSRLQDAHRTFDRVLESLIADYGKPMPISILAQELGIVFERPGIAYVDMLPRQLGASDKFFPVEGDSYGLTSWLVVAESESADDVLFNNGMAADEVAPYRKAAGKIGWTADDLAGSAEEVVKAIGGQAPLRVVEFLAWQSLGADYDPVALYCAVLKSDSLDVLSSQSIVTSDRKEQLMKALLELDTELEDLAPGVEEEAVESGPVTVSDGDRDEIVSYVLKHGGAVAGGEILESIIEIGPGERRYEAALESLREALKDEERLVRVGQDIWRPSGTLPDYINEVPDVLLIPAHAPFETPEGDVYDQEIEDEGLDAVLKQEILNPLAQDIGDEDPKDTHYQPLDNFQRCVLKYHHKEAGTLPLIQFNPGFFGDDPQVTQITIVNEGVRREAWVNHKTRLIYGLKDFYVGEMPISGAALEVHRAERPGEFRLIYENRTDPMVFVPTSRLMELLTLKGEAESSEMSLFEIITRILEHYRKGIGFVPLFTEVNLVRRSTRRLVASVLSSYHCFHTRGKTGEWQYDIKKRSQGFNKAKRKYVKK